MTTGLPSAGSLQSFTGALRKHLMIMPGESISQTAIRHPLQSHPLFAFAVSGNFKRKAMKRSCLLPLLLACLISGLSTVRAQTIITNDPAYTVPVSGALLDVKDLHRGFLPPRVSLLSVTDVVTVPSPATGLLVYNTNASITGGSGAGYYYFNGTEWQGFSTGMHYIGEDYEGGKIIWLDGISQHGLVAALADETITNSEYGGWMNLIMARADGIEGGYINTLLINTITGLSQVYSATLCSQKTVSSGGNTISGWYLPSKYELDILYDNRTLVGGFTSNSYWSSTEASAVNAWMQDFSTGTQSSTMKLVSGYVRCVRKF
jgi:hypothetical protein